MKNKMYGLENTDTGVPANPAFDIIVPQFKCVITGSGYLKIAR
jgi:hypothetical protein